MNAGIFIAGALVTMIVVVAMGVLLWGLRLETRANRREQAARKKGVIENAHND